MKEPMFQIQVKCTTKIAMKTIRLPDWARSSNNWFCAISCNFCILETLSLACCNWSCSACSLHTIKRSSY